MSLSQNPDTGIARKNEYLKSMWPPCTIAEINYLNHIKSNPLCTLPCSLGRGGYIYTTGLNIKLTNGGVILQGINSRGTEARLRLGLRPNLDVLHVLSDILANVAHHITSNQYVVKYPAPLGLIDYQAYTQQKLDTSMLPLSESKRHRVSTSGLVVIAYPTQILIKAINSRRKLTSAAIGMPLNAVVLLEVARGLSLAANRLAELIAVDLELANLTA